MQQLHRHLGRTALSYVELPAVAVAAVATAATAAAVATAATAPPSLAQQQQRSRSTMSTGRYTVTGQNKVAADGDAAEPAARRSPPAAGATVVLVSGGVEAATLLQTWKHWDHGHGPFASSVLPLFVDFGHRNAAQERRAAAALCSHVGLELASLNAAMLSHQLLSFAEGGLRSQAPLPHRNLALLSMAASYAGSVGAANVAVCFNKDDAEVQPEASLAFLRHVEPLFESLQPSLQLLMPLLGLRKQQVVLLGEQVGAPWHLTYSCVAGEERHCGACDPCRRRAEAFAGAAVADPLQLGS